MARVAVVGAGMMGSAFCVPLLDRGHTVHLIGTPLDTAIIAALQSGAPHPGLAHGLPAGLKVYQAAQADAVFDDVDHFVLGVSSAGVTWAAERLASTLTRSPRPVLMLSKGLFASPTGAQVQSQLFETALPVALRAEVCGSPASVCGPCIAGELLRRVPTVVAVASRQPGVAIGFAELAQTDYYRMVTVPDVVGVQVCAALKNAYALGVAFGAGLHERSGGSAGSVALHNYEAAVFAQAMIEMDAVVRSLGGNPATTLGLAGTGDLMVTCNGGRTGRFGRLLGAGHPLPQAIELMEGATLECLEVLAALRRCVSGPGGLAGLTASRLPLLRHLCAVALDGDDVDMPWSEFFAP